MKTTSVKFNTQQIDLLRGVLYEYYKSNEYFDNLEKQLHNEVEQILANAENKIYE